MPVVLEDLPEIEYIDGKGYRKVSPKRTHAIVQAALLGIFSRCAQQRGSVGPEWRFHLTSKTSLVPDVSFVSYERLRTLSDEEAEEPPFAPDIVAEVRSPSNRAAPLAAKTRLYLEHGALLVLDVHPKTRAIRAHTKAGVAAYRCGERFTCESVPWLVFEVDELFEKLDIPR
ncbi:MAG TPA: Uma2 family endonuclease [Candidatus Baltobacteraceae bacterium]|nr:Uma2 family endonuclease [Candidatus Baltobacteraceae bacterium]